MTNVSPKVVKRFNPKQYVTMLKNKPYLETRWRIVWMRKKHPNWSIDTELISADPVFMKAVIRNEDGFIIATGHGSANDPTGRAVWTGRAIEKAETAAIGRALAHAGFGTQFMESDSDHLADSPGSEAREVFRRTALSYGYKTDEEIGQAMKQLGLGKYDPERHDEQLRQLADYKKET